MVRNRVADRPNGMTANREPAAASVAPLLFTDGASRTQTLSVQPTNNGKLSAVTDCGVKTG